MLLHALDDDGATSRGMPVAALLRRVGHRDDEVAASEDSGAWCEAAAAA